jgi:hypothetical protein
MASGELVVAESHSIRLVSLPEFVYTSFSIDSIGRVSTLAGAGKEVSYKL